MSEGLSTFLILLIALRESVKIIESLRSWFLMRWRALRIAIHSAVNIEQGFESLYMYSDVSQMTTAPTPSVLLDASVNIFSPRKSWIRSK